MNAAIRHIPRSKKIEASLDPRGRRRDEGLVAYKVGERGQLRVNEREIERYLEAQRVRVEETTEMERGE